MHAYAGAAMDRAGPGGRDVIAPLHLSAANLGLVPPDVHAPAYDRRELVPSLVHIGVGGFHRAHQALYLDDLIDLTLDTQWGYCGVGLLPQDLGMRNAMLSQDCLYTVVERGPEGDSARVVGSIVDFLFAPDDRERVLAKLASPECRIVTLTITEGGYYRNDATGEFLDTHPDVVRDLAHPHAPDCSFGYLLEGLDRRRRAGLGPFTIFSCDNLQHNGEVARRMLLAFAELRDPALRRWIEEHVAFPSCMVDRIVPATTDEHRALVADSFGIADAWPVVTEPFRQWVIEDYFPHGRPSWKRVGAQMTTDLEPYERMKMRLLNGSHQALAYIGLLVGYEYAHEAVGDPTLRALVRRMMADEVAPLLKPVPGIDLDAYQRTLLERFANPAVGDRLARIATDSSTRMPKFVLPSIAESLRRGGPIDVLAFTVAAWFHYLAGRDDRGLRLEIVDPQRERLMRAAADPDVDCEALFGLADLIEPAIAQSPRFRDLVQRILRSFRTQGARMTLERYLDTSTMQ